MTYDKKGDDNKDLKEKLLKIVSKRVVSLGELSRLMDRSKETIAKIIAELNEEGHAVIYEEDSHQVIFGRKEKLKPLTLKQLKGRTARIGIVSDVHLGSRYSNLSILQLAYREFEKQRCQVILNPGDLVDGFKMYRGHQNEVFLHSAEDMVDYTVENYPQVKGIKTVFICGNHDLSFVKACGSNVGRQIGLRRKDMVWRGDESAEFLFKEFKISMLHPAGGSSYAVSYRPQKHVEAEVTTALAIGETPPNLILLGHCHRYGTFRQISTYSVMCGTLESITPYMKRKALVPDVGFIILTLEFDKEGKIKKFLPEWYDCSGLTREGDY